MRRQAEQLLYARIDPGAPFGRVVDGEAAAGRRRPPRRRLRRQAPLQVPRDQSL